MRMKKIVYLGPSECVACVREVLGSGFDLLPVSPDLASVEQAIPSADAILDASMKVPLDSTLLSRAASLSLVITATTGADHIDATHLASRQIPLLTLKTERDLLEKVNAAAELSWALLMGCARRLREASSHVLDGGWDRTLFPGPMLRGKCLGLVGFGRNGRWCAQYGRAFGMTLLASDPQVTQWPEDISACDLSELVPRADFLLVHVAFLESTRNLLHKDLIATAKQGSVWVNTSRGSIWDEEALAQAVAQGRIAAVGADVLAPEPDIRRSPLWQLAQHHPSILLTPHIGGFSPDALSTVLRHTATRLRDFYELRH